MTMRHHCRIFKHFKIITLLLTNVYISVLHRIHWRFECIVDFMKPTCKVLTDIDKSNPFVTWQHIIAYLSRSGKARIQKDSAWLISNDLQTSLSLAWFSSTVTFGHKLCDNSYIVKGEKWGHIWLTKNIFWP